MQYPMMFERFIGSDHSGGIRLIIDISTLRTSADARFLEYARSKHYGAACVANIGHDGYSGTKGKNSADDIARASTASQMGLSTTLAKAFSRLTKRVINDHASQGTHSKIQSTPSRS